jgi:predicted TIM-barrel enzyme
MKKLLTTAFVIGAMATSASAHAFDLGSLAKEATKVIPGMSCTDQATDLIKSGGAKAIDVYTKVSAGEVVDTEVLDVSDETVTKVTTYVSTGCAKDHLTTALEAVTILAQ